MEPSGEAEIDWHTDGVLAIFPITRERCRVIADVGPSETDKDRPEPTLKDIQTVLTKRGRGRMTASDRQWLGSFHINERQVADYRAGRVFLAGDSAHVYSPAGGQGMNTGMQDAVNLAWKLALVCRNLCAQEPLLGSYSLERSVVGEQVLKNTGRITSLAILRGDVKQSIRNHIASMLFGFAPICNAMVQTIAEISVGYPDSPLSEQGTRVHGGPVAGQRAPVRAGETPFGAGDTPRFALCADATNETAKRAGGVMLGLYKHLLEPEFRMPFAKGGIWLVRPDGYIALATGLNGWDEVAAYIDGIVGRLSTWRVEAVKENLAAQDTSK